MRINVIKFPLNYNCINIKKKLTEVKISRSIVHIPNAVIEHPEFVESN